ncbi:hypothetical protein [Pigmentiphaga humi]|uniref:hypothetical protein n=1 Tax=Pigmentiphaga humi TaxID=2478468 RepID=UPI000F52FB07|nr:hypothetical protein [Pigmentiphaga humi]
MSGYDHYAEAKSIADSIEAKGFPDQAMAVRSAIDDGRSGIEIFMQLRFYLAPFEGNEKIDPTTQFRIAGLLSRVNEALNR